MMMLMTMMMMPGSVEGCWAKDAGGWSTGSDTGTVSLLLLLLRTKKKSRAGVNDDDDANSINNNQKNKIVKKLKINRK